MRQTTRRRYEPDAAALTTVRSAKRASDRARDKARESEDALAVALLEAAQGGWTMRELASASDLTLSSVYRRITEAEKAR